MTFILRITLICGGVILLVMAIFLTFLRQQEATISPFIVFMSERDGNLEIYTMRSDGTRQRNLTQHPDMDFAAHWTSDGQWIIFRSWRGEHLADYRIRPDGSHLEELTQLPKWQEPRMVSSDGQWLVDEQQDDIYRIHPDGTHEENLTAHSIHDFDPTWSPPIDLPWHGWIIGLIGISALAIALRWQPSTFQT